MEKSTDEKRRTAACPRTVDRNVLRTFGAFAFVLLVFVVLVPPLSAQDCHDPINGCSPPAAPPDDEGGSSGGVSGSYTCSACPMIADEYSEISSLYYGEGSPGPALTESPDASLVSLDGRELQRLLVALDSGGYLSEAQALIVGSTESYADAQDAASQRAEVVELASMTANSSVAGDPNILATGTFVHSETDLVFRVGETRAAVERTYRSDRSQWSSFGAGWSCNGDSRIVLGINPDLGTVCNELRSAVEQLHTYIRECDARVAETDLRLRDHRERIIGPHAIAAEAVAASARDLRDRAVKSATGSTGAQIVAQCEELWSATAETADHYRGMIASLSSGIAALRDFAPGGPSREAVAELAKDLDHLAEQADREYVRSNAHEAKNRFAVHASDPPEYSLCGVYSVTLIDRQGVPHLYRFESPTEERESGSRSRYADGSPNYYPNGAFLSPAHPLDPVLFLQPDGGWLLRCRDGNTVQFDFNGMIEREADRNGNAVEYLRSERGKLTAIVDDCARRLELATEGERIVQAVDPLGRTVSYTYDTGGRLSAVTDAVGYCVRYHYTGSLLTAIEKPDKSRIAYDYEERSGRTVLVATTDEEGWSERFEYGEGWTVHTGRSGIETTHRFDARMLEISEEYPSGAGRTNEYDERGELIRCTDELGRAVFYQRDERGNILRTTLADGTALAAQFDQNDRKIAETNTRGLVTTFTYDDSGNLLSTTNPDGTRRSYTYDSRGNRLSSTDELGNSTRFTYDRFGYLASKRASDGGVVRFEHDAVGNLVSVTDQLGYRNRFEYTEDNLLAKAVDRLGCSELFVYDSRRDLVEHVDRLGVSTHFDYDQRHLCVRITGPAGDTRSFGYRADGRIAELKVDARATTSYEYDDRGRVSAIEQLGVRRTLEHDAAGQVVAVTDANGNTTRFERDSVGRITTIIDPLGGKRRLSYDPTGNRVASCDSLGAMTEFRFDARGRFVGIHDALGGWQRFTYDPTGNLASYTNENGARTSYQWDSCNRLAAVIDPLGTAKRYTYTLRGELCSYTDPRASTWSYSYDATGRLVEIIDPLGGRRAVTYDDGGHPVAVVDPNGNETRLVYDGAGRLTKSIDPYGAVVTRTYSSLGALESVVGKRGEVWRFSYDSLGRLVATVDPLELRTTYRYDNVGNLLGVQAPGGAETRFEYDALNSLRSRVDPSGRAVTWRYDREGRLTTETDPLGHSYSWSYDALGRLVGETNRSGRTRRYEYDPAGNLIGEHDFNQVEARYRYDALGRTIAEEGPDGTVAFSYNAAGNLIEARNSIRSVHFEYDALSRLLTTTESRTGSRQSYRYDRNGNCVERRDLSIGHANYFSYGRSDELRSVMNDRRARTLFEYDADGNLVLVRRPNGIVERRSYDLTGRPTSLVVGGGTVGRSGPVVWGQVYLYDTAGRRAFTFDSRHGVAAYRYDNCGRLIEASLPPASPVFNELARRAASLGCPSRLPAVVTGAASFSGEPTGQPRPVSEYLEIDSVQVSKLQRLIDATMPLSKALFHPRTPIVRVTYSYDPAGNRISQTGPWGEIGYTYGVDHELLSAGHRQFSYDHNGNLVRETFGDEHITYRYTASNRLAKVLFSDPRPARTADGALTAVAPTDIEYAYDSFGRRTRRRTQWLPVPSAASASALDSLESSSRGGPQIALTEECYDYVGLSLQLLRTTLHTVQSSSSAAKSPAVGRGGRYRYLSPTSSERADPPEEVVSRLYAGDRLLESVSNDVYRYHTTDPLGSIVATTDSAGAVVDIIDYAPFGASPVDTIGTRMKPGFAAKDHDPLTGLYDFGMRDYSPTLARWTSPDPIKSGIDWYRYAHNDPINFVDPTGLLLESVSLTYYQDRNPRTGVPESYSDVTLGEVPESASTDTRRTPETIGQYGCLLTAATRIANSIKKDDSSTPNNANTVAIQGRLFSAAESGQVDELTPQSTAELISQLSSFPITTETYSGTKETLQRELSNLSEDEFEHYVVGQLLVGEGDSAYSHYLNIQAINENGQIKVADTSVTDRSFLNWTTEPMVGMMVYTPKSK